MKRPNPTDLTLRNNRKTRADIKALTARVKALERLVKALQMTAVLTDLAPRRSKEK